VQPFLGVATHLSHGRSAPGEHNGQFAAVHTENGKVSPRIEAARLQGPVSSWVNIKESKPKVALVGRIAELVLRQFWPFHEALPVPSADQ